MFEAIKVKATKGKQWVKDHERDIQDFGWSMFGAVVGVGTYVLLDKLDDSKRSKENRKKYPNEYRALDSRSQADHVYSGAGAFGPTVENLSKSLVEYGADKDATVVGTLIYTKKN